MFTAAATASRHLLRRGAVTAAPLRRVWAVKQRALATTTVAEEFEQYGKNVFTGKVADDYLQKHGASAELLKDPTWVNHSSDKVAAAVFDWYVLARTGAGDGIQGCIGRLPCLQLKTLSNLTCQRLAFFNTHTHTHSHTHILYCAGRWITARTCTVTGSNRWEPPVSVTASRVKCRT
jgi:hypothetical protein